MAMSFSATAPSGVPVNDADPFGLDILADPLPFQAALRDAGPVVYLRRYDTFALARYEHVHAALTDCRRSNPPPASV